MKINKYIVKNAFSAIGEEERKDRINNAIRSLCIRDIEKAANFDYNIDVTFHGGDSDLKKGGTL
ncbi:MAG: hypothetical protein E7545_05640 [Ruminococcaceae bacterium]|nr:hypothetical protein [Oscillospiraceae bacterium]